MRLTELIDSRDTAAASIAGDPEIAGVTADSRKVQPGFLFAAIPGMRTDGRNFIAEAVKRGAVAVVAPPDTPLPAAAKRTKKRARVALICDDNPRRRLALMAARFFGPQPRLVVGVTGTNGKTSVAGFTRQIWQMLGHRAASLGTLGIEGADQGDLGPLTTPDPVALHETLAALAAAGNEHVVMEASSHGLSQSRLDGVHFKAAGFTNFTRDHLDYHGTMEAYLEAKKWLFSSLLPVDGMAVLNAADPHYQSLADACLERGCRVISYGPDNADLCLESRTPGADGQDLVITVFGRSYELGVPLLGAFQAANILCALGLVIACDDDAEAAIHCLPHLTGAPGRLQQVARRGNGAPIYVDYAHTPDALETVLKALRPHTAGRLVVVFGCGGDRDRGKRPMMGKIAAEFADMSIVTDDNPRTEDAASVRAEILAACPGARDIGDRAEAIHEAAAALGPGDVLLVAGKGHEQGQIVGTDVRPFDDGSVATGAVAELDGEVPR